MPVATTAFISRAPSICVPIPCAWAISATWFNVSSDHTVPPPRLAVCSTATSVCDGALRVGVQIPASKASTENWPPSPSSPITWAPAMAEVPPDSLVRICEDLCARIASPGWQCTAIEIWLHIVPLGRNTAASLPIIAAIRSHSALMVGSSPPCSSPVSAAIIASFMARVGRVWVSEYRLTRVGGMPGAGAVGA